MTITGAPAASAEAVSPPATEKASGKLLAANTATGPSGTSRCRKSGFGSGVRSGSAVSSRAWVQPPSLNDGGEHPQLPGGAGGFALNPNQRDPGFGVNPLSQYRTECFDFLGDRVEEGGAVVEGGVPVGFERVPRERRGPVHVDGGRVVVDGFQGGPGGGVGRLERGAGTR